MSRCFAFATIALAATVLAALLSGPVAADCGHIPVDPGTDSGAGSGNAGGEGNVTPGSQGGPDDLDGQGGVKPGSGVGGPDDLGGQGGDNAGGPGDMGSQGSEGATGSSAGDKAWNDWSANVPVALRSSTLKEPSQKAVIAWNQREEIMVLTTKLQGTKPMKVLEIMPLPSRPKVTQGDAKLFDKAIQLLKSKSGTRSAQTVARLLGGEVVETVKIGYHNITVARVLNAKQFVDWAEQYAKGRLGENAKVGISATGRKMIEQYLAEGYKYWIFDLIDLDGKPQPHVAVQLRFQTDFLYFPLKITRSMGQGETNVELLVLTDQTLTHFRGTEHTRIQSPHPAAAVTAAELQGLSPEIAGMFGSQPVKLRYWQIKAPIQSFNGDLVGSTRPIRGIRFQ